MLNPKAFGLSGGVLWGLAMLVLTFVGMNAEYGASFFAFMMDVYPGYEMTMAGAFIGLVYGFLDGFIGLYLFAWLYNWFDKK